MRHRHHEMKLLKAEDIHNLTQERSSPDPKPDTLDPKLPPTLGTRLLSAEP